MQIKNILLAASLATIAYAQAPEEGTPETVTGAQGDAQTFESPKGETKPHVADFTGTKLTGSILFHPYDAEGVHWVLNMGGFPAEGGPFGWHVHDQPVPADGNCTGTKAHLDPYQRGQKVACDSDRPESCEVGDLAGKFGKIPADSKDNYSVTQSGIDKFITLQEGVGSFIGNRSIVIHLADGSRYACANITVLKEAHNNGTGGHGDPDKPLEEGAAVALGPGFWTVALAAAGLATYLL